MLIVSVIAAFALFTSSIKTVEISDGKSKSLVKSFSGSIIEAAKTLGYDSGDYEVLSEKANSGKLSARIEPTFPVTIISGDKTVTVHTASAKVSKILKKAGFKVDEFDMVEPSVDTVITKKATIDYVDINYITEDSTEVIPYEVKTIFSQKLSSGVSSSTTGSNGLKVVNYTRKIVNGVEVLKTVNREQIISSPVNCVRTVGIKGNSRITTGVAVTTSNYADCYSTLVPASAVPLDENGVPTNYTSHMTVEATAYTYTGHNTSTGRPPQPGYIAVNPEIIPYGTRMYIISSDGNWVYGYAEAADTGGFVSTRPTNIDLFFETVAQFFSFGRRNVEIYFLP